MPEHPKATVEGYVREHIVVAEYKLGRPLSKDEVVHHLDENKYNNEPENLIVFKTNADHSAFHKGVDAVQDGDVWWCPDKSINKMKTCPVCNSRNMYYTSNTCIECKTKLSRKAERPSSEKLFELIKTTSFVQIGKMYGVSDNAIKKWCKEYGLPYKRKNIKTKLK